MPQKETTLFENKIPKKYITKKRVQATAKKKHLLYTKKNFQANVTYLKIVP